MQAAANAYLVDLVVRMGQTMEREYGHDFEADRFLNDGSYATLILAQALNSRSPELHDQADQVRRELTGMPPLVRARQVTVFERYMEMLGLGSRPAVDGSPA